MIQAISYLHLLLLRMKRLIFTFSLAVLKPTSECCWNLIREESLIIGQYCIAYTYLHVLHCLLRAISKYCFYIISFALQALYSVAFTDYDLHPYLQKRGREKNNNHAGENLLFFLLLNRLFTWILPYYCPSFSKVYERIFSKYFKPAEIKRIEFELRGSIVIHPAERFKNEDSRIISGFQSWGLRSAGYILDALTYEVITAEKVLNAKAKRLNVSVSQVPLKSADKVKLTTTFLNTSFYGETGTVLFSKECNRLTNIFNILNFIPTETGLIHHHIAGLIIQGPSNNSILYLHNNGTLSGGSTLIFNDGTSNIPADYKKKLFTRCKSSPVCIYVCVDIALI